MKCPQCNKPVDEGAEFCSACGAQVVENATDVARVAGIQEDIKECRSGRKWFLWVMAGGMLFAVSPFFICLFVLILAVLADQPMPNTPPGFEYFIWSVPIGAAVAIGGIIGAIYYDNKMKKFRAQLTGRRK